MLVGDGTPNLSEEGLITTAFWSCAAEDLRYSHLAPVNSVTKNHFRGI